ncbi:hypothetical protein [Streptomyces sp. CA-106110]|uniref:hypothetical protein n=1 Tax=Streptomyces sp. CA-106110 TaxID=3240044 RepID=UPI003D8F58E0
MPTLTRLTSLTSTNRPRPGAGIGHGDIVQFTTRGGLRSEGMVTSNASTRDRNNISWITVRDKNGRAHPAQFSECVRVDPPIQPEDDSPRRPFDDRNGH